MDFKIRIFLHFIFLIIIILLYVLKRDIFKDKVKSIVELSFIITMYSYLFIVLSPNAKYIFGMNYINAILIIFSVCLMLFSYGLIKNKESMYKKNLNIYMVLYLILLLSITIFIGRINVSFKISNLRYFNPDFLIPGRSILGFLKQNVSLRTKVYNIFGNAILLIPFSFLLITNNDKYKNILKQIKILIPVTVSIEFLQLLTRTGSFDIDDIILNFLGAIIFVFIITGFNISNKIRKLFYRDFGINIKLKKYLLFISLLAQLVFFISTVIISIRFIYM